MADNVIANPGAGGSTFASDEIASVQYPRVKLIHGADGTNDGDVSSANGLPVAQEGTWTVAVSGTVAATQSGSWTVAATQSGAWAVTANAGTNLNTSALSLESGGNLDTISAGFAAEAAALGSGVLMQGDDGADRKNINVDATTGDVQVDVTNTVTISGTVTASNATGNVAHDAADSGNPVKVGGKASSTAPTAVAADDRVDFIADLTGRQIVAPYAPPADLISGFTAAMTGTANTTVISSQGAGTRLYITQILVTNSHATVGTLVQIREGSTLIYQGYARQDGGGFALTFAAPLRLADNSSLVVSNATTGSNTYASASGYKSNI